ncbi:MAG: ABC transporter permease [Desulfovibrionaceae bacterium]|nr:ABC transporter permease [Desulfovibrionaceae bacterium]
MNTQIISAARQMDFFFRLNEVWRYRNVLFTLAGRELKARYKQAFFGVLWALLQPLATAVIYTVIFGVFARFSAGDDIPYPVFALTGVLIWQFFSRSLGSGSTSLAGNAGLIGKIYFPRVYLLLVPLLVAAVDFFLAFVLLIGGSMALFHLPVTIKLLALPVVTLWAGLFAFSIALILAPLHGLYRDVGFIVPFLTQFYMFATPVMYPPSIIPERFQWLVECNPAATLVGLTRWSVLNTDPPTMLALALCFFVPLVLGAIGFQIFFRMENTLVDRI